MDNLEKQLFLGHEPKIELFNPIKNSESFKPSCGLWTSTYSNNKSEWVEWCEANDFWTTSNKDGWLLTVKPDARIVKIDSLKDLQHIYAQYGLGMLGFMTVLDYEEMAKDYDGIWLTSKGQWDTRFSKPSLYGWDVECTIWFDYVFDKVEYLGKYDESKEVFTNENNCKILK